MIEFAHQGHPESPSYKSAENWMRLQDSTDGNVIDPNQMKFTSQKLLQGNELAKAERLAREEREAARRNAVNGAGNDAAKGGGS